MSVEQIDKIRFLGHHLMFPLVGIAAILAKEDGDIRGGVREDVYANVFLADGLDRALIKLRQQYAHDHLRVGE